MVDEPSFIVVLPPGSDAARLDVPPEIHFAGTACPCGKAHLDRPSHGLVTVASPRDASDPWLQGRNAWRTLAVVNAEESNVPLPCPRVVIPQSLGGPFGLSLVIHNLTVGFIGQKLIGYLPNDFATIVDTCDRFDLHAADGASWVEAAKKIAENMRTAPHGQSLHVALSGSSTLHDANLATTIIADGAGPDDDVMWQIDFDRTRGAGCSVSVLVGTKRA